MKDAKIWMACKLIYWCTANAQILQCKDDSFQYCCGLFPLYIGIEMEIADSAQNFGAKFCSLDLYVYMKVICSSNVA